MSRTIPAHIVSDKIRKQLAVIIAQMNIIEKKLKDYEKRSKKAKLSIFELKERNSWANEFKKLDKQFSILAPSLTQIMVQIANSPKCRYKKGDTVNLKVEIADKSISSFKVESVYWDYIKKEWICVLASNLNKDFRLEFYESSLIGLTQ